MNRWRCGVAMILGLAAMPAWAAMKTQPVEWKHQGTTFSGVLVYDDGEHDKRPGLVMVPNWKGVNESAIEKAKQLAGDDYVVLVADVYGKGVLLDDAEQAGGFDALLEFQDHKPFECVGEGRESRAAMATLAQRPEWKEDVLVKRFCNEIQPQLDAAELELTPLLQLQGEHRVPAALWERVREDFEA